PCRAPNRHHSAKEALLLALLHHTLRKKLRTSSGIGVALLASLAHSRNAVRHASNGLLLKRCSDAVTLTSRLPLPIDKATSTVRNPNATSRVASVGKSLMAPCGQLRPLTGFRARQKTTSSAGGEKLTWNRKPSRSQLSPSTKKKEGVVTT